MIREYNHSANPSPSPSHESSLFGANCREDQHRKGPPLGRFGPSVWVVASSVKPSSSFLPPPLQAPRLLARTRELKSPPLLQRPMIRAQSAQVPVLSDRRWPFPFTCLLAAPPFSLVPRITFALSSCRVSCLFLPSPAIMLPTRWIKSLQEFRAADRDDSFVVAPY